VSLEGRSPRHPAGPGPPSAAAGRRAAAGFGAMVKRECFSPNKADMSWLLNGGEENAAQPDPAANERSVKARPSDAGMCARDDWLRDAPMLYNLAVNAGIAASAMGPLSTNNSLLPSSAAPSSAAAQAPKPWGMEDGVHQARACSTSSAMRAAEQISSSRMSDSFETSAESDVSGGEQRRKSWSVSLDEELAIEIYACRPRNAGSKYGSMAEAVRLGEKHGVSPKTIRDIWNHKSWVRVTRAYWTQAEALAYVPRRHRPSSPREAARGGSPKRRGRGQGKAG